MTQALASSRAGWWLILALIVAFAAQMVVVNGLPAATATQTTLLAEGGFYESLSVVGYILCILALVWTLRGAVQRVWYLPLVLAVMAARELDLDKSLFTRGLFKARQYTGEGVPLGERLIAGLILALIVTAILLMLWRHARPYLTALSAGDRFHRRLQTARRHRAQTRPLGDRGQRRCRTHRLRRRGDRGAWHPGHVPRRHPAVARPCACHGPSHQPGAPRLTPPGPAPGIKHHRPRKKSWPY